jgi:hypothetical protein
MSQQALEGTWEEIASHADELEGKRVRLTVLEEVVSPLPNEAMLAALREVGEIQQGMGLTSGEGTQALLQDARDGRMYGHDSHD